MHATELIQTNLGGCCQSVDKTLSQAGKSRDSAAREREPWVLATSLPGGSAVTDEVIEFYVRHMQIEESFQDTKDKYYGLGLNRSRSRSADRFTILLLINALAFFAAWLFGKVAELRELHRHYQANTIRTRRVLSHVFLGLRVLSRQPIPLTRELLRQAQADLTQELHPSVTGRGL